MADKNSRNTHLGGHRLHPETLMPGYGYDPGLSEGAVKPPVFLTATFMFRPAGEGRDHVDVVSGRRSPRRAEGALLFSAGMSAIDTAILAHARPGDAILHSQPLHGGIETLLLRTLGHYGMAA